MLPVLLWIAKAVWKVMCPIAALFSIFFFFLLYSFINISTLGNFLETVLSFKEYSNLDTFQAFITSLNCTITDKACVISLY